MKKYTAFEKSIKMKKLGELTIPKIILKEHGWKEGDVLSFTRFSSGMYLLSY